MAIGKLRSLHTARHRDRFALAKAFQRAADFAEPTVASYVSLFEQWMAHDLQGALMDIATDAEEYPVKGVEHPEPLEV